MAEAGKSLWPSLCLFSSSSHKTLTWDVPWRKGPSVSPRWRRPERIGTNRSCQVPPFATFCSLFYHICPRLSTLQQTQHQNTWASPNLQVFIFLGRPLCHIKRIWNKCACFSPVNLFLSVKFSDPARGPKKVENFSSPLQSSLFLPSSSLLLHVTSWQMVSSGPPAGCFSSVLSSLLYIPVDKLFKTPILSS